MVYGLWFMVSAFIGVGGIMVEGAARTPTPPETRF